MRVRRDVTRRLRVELVPLIDCFFLVLAFFVYSLFSMTIQRGLPVELPKAGGHPVGKKGFITITLRRDGGLFFEERAVEKSTLSLLLVAERKDNPDIQVFLRADKDVTYQQAVEVMDIVRSAGILKLTLETQWKVR